MIRACAKCGGPIPLQAGRGRRRTKCEACSPSRTAPKRLTVMPLPAGGESLVDATIRELQSAGTEATALGQASLLLARRIEAGQDGGSAIASLVKQWQDTMGKATAAAEPVAMSLTDQLKARRDARRNA